MPDEGGQTDPEQGERQAGRHLIGLQVEGEETEHQRHRDAGGGGGQKSDGAAAGGEGRRETGHRPDQHHAFDAQIEDAGAFDHSFAERRIDQRRGGHHRAGNHRNQRIHVTAPSAAGLDAGGSTTATTRFSRKLMNRSAASR